MVKKKRKVARTNKIQREFEVPLWFIDGFIGILALMIYNFILYILTLIGIKGVVGKIENTMGYFGLNSFIEFGWSPGSITLGIILFFVISFVLGIGIGSYVRKRIKGKISKDI